MDLAGWCASRFAAATASLGVASAPPLRPLLLCVVIVAFTPLCACLPACCCRWSIVAWGLGHLRQTTHEHGLGLGQTRDAKGDNVYLSFWKGYVLLIVNVASQVFKIMKVEEGMTLDMKDWVVLFRDDTKLTVINLFGYGI
ncbi:hypothetical protein IFM89_029558 [Coptis chinensis]|uniref:Uncharacterized protein n=1 Tax=Coptis chinensis TaxID=261450 RepID=A0A835LEY0_9MAGN|nr:hypothetical protein IFM89_029558 [Coptis chinensis]